MTEPPAGSLRVQRLFLRFLGVIYLIAFVSLWFQIDGLIGSHGILPAERLMQLAWNKIPGRVDLLPTLAWFDSSDLFLHLLCAGGVFFSLLVIAGLLQQASLFFLWVLHLSLVTVSQDFLSFQWDNLLLETGFLAIFFAGKSSPSKVVLFLLRWLLFRLMFESGSVKLLSGDLTWRSLTTLTFHYETQPLPTWIGWYAHQLPVWFQKFSCGVMFFIELAVPFSIFGPRRIRLIGCAALVFLQILILLTGNYCFFNLLTIALCLLLLGKGAPRPMAPEPEVRGVPQKAGINPASLIVVFLTILIFAITTLQLAGMFLGRRNLPLPLRRVLAIVAPFRTINNYGLFAVMTTDRREIVIEGSDDGQNWREYGFKYKPGDLKGRPRFVAPHQPRLDWQMWFAALERCGESPWFINFLDHLKKGTPEVLNLLAYNPFPNAPPREIRAVVYGYHFTDPAAKRATGEWWRREYQGLYCPVLKKSS